MYCDPARRDRINSFALVSYVPDPLAGFLDSLRQELVPECFLHAHVTTLPPRALGAPVEEAWRQVTDLAPVLKPFDVELTEVQKFDSGVIYIEIGAGSDRLKEMHEVLNANRLKYEEPFEFVPHVTLAQALEPDQLDELRIVAKRRWEEYRGSRSFRVETITFVQSTAGKMWIDLGECRLGTGDAKLIEPIAVP